MHFKWLSLIFAFIHCFNIANPEIIITPLFINAYRLQFYSSVVPYLVREYKRKNVPNSGIRILHENDPDIRSNLEGEVAIITGGTRGIGIEVVRTFLRKGCHVITTSSSAKAEVISARYNKTIEGIEPGKWKLEIWHLDLMSLKSVMNFVDHFKSKNYTQLNYFIANAGIMFPKYKVSIDGYESQFQTNYLGHVLLTYHFMPYLYHSAKRIGHQSRLVLVSSCLHHIPNRIRFEDLQSVQVYSPHYAYGLSKLAIVMFVYRLSRTFKMKTDWTDQVKPFSLHPGLVDTDLLSTIELLKEYPFLANRIALRSVKAGAETTIFAALSNQLDRKTGEYLEDSRIAQSSALSYNEDYQNRLWYATAKMLAPWTNGLWFEDLHS